MFNCFLVPTLGLKWYENPPPFPNVAQRQEQVWTDLYYYGCCQDKLECSRNNTPGYLGVDVFMPFINYGTQPTVLIIHQVNIMYTLAFEANLQVKERQTGAMNVLASYNRHQDSFAEKLNTMCPHQQGKKTGRYITGFSVQQEYYLVCENLVIVARIQGYWSSHMERHYNRSQCSTLPHPALCDHDEGQLMSIAVIPKKVNDDDPAIIGFYSKTGVKVEGRAPRAYVVSAWPFQNAIKDAPILTSKMNGRLSEIDSYKSSNTGFEAMYFTNDGNACHLNETYQDWFDSNGKLKKLNFEDLNLIRKPCESFQTYIGCSMPWCFSNKFDASFTINLNGKTTLYFIKGFFYWIMDDYGLPLDIPRIVDARKPKYYGNVPDAYPCLELANDPDSVVCMTRDIGAAFAFVPPNSPNQLYVYLNHIVKGQFLIMIANNKSRTTTFHPDPFPNGTGRYDAAWYNWNESAVYLFNDQNYRSHDHVQGSARRWSQRRQGTLKDFGIEFTLLDAVVNRNGTGYFFSGNFLYAVPEKNWTSGVDNSKIFSMEMFFDVRKECYVNYHETFNDLARRSGFDAKIEIEKGGVATTKAKTVRRSAERSYHFIVYFSVGGTLVVVGAWILMYFFSVGKRPSLKFVRRSPKAKVKRSKKLPMDNKRQKRYRRNL